MQHNSLLFVICSWYFLLSLSSPPLNYFLPFNNFQQSHCAKIFKFQNDSLSCRSIKLSETTERGNKSHVKINNVKAWLTINKIKLSNTIFLMYILKMGFCVVGHFVFVFCFISENIKNVSEYNKHKLFEFTMKKWIGWSALYEYLLILLVFVRTFFWLINRVDDHHHHLVYR